MITLKDIAREAGVSAVTVSNVINGKHAKVSEATIARINALIEKYHYIPNASARSLAKQSSRIIGVIIPHINDSSNILTSPYDAELIGVLERVIREKGYYLMFRCTSTDEETARILQMWQVDGAIILAGMSNDKIENLKESLTMPVVFLDCFSERKDIMKVRTDDFKGGYIASRYLLNNGHTQIAYAGSHIDNECLVVNMRFSGFLKALKERGITFNENFLFEGTTNYESGIEIGKQISQIASEITAVCCSADIIALGIIEGLRINGLRVPEDLSIIGFDNLPLCVYASPKLTTIAQDISAKARETAHMLIEAIENGASSENTLLMDVHIVERQTVKKINFS